MVNQLAVRLKYSFGVNKNIICVMVFILTYLGCFGQVQKNISIDKSRGYILSGQINDAVITYALVAKDSDDPVLISEYAYALALGGIYDAALIELDRLWLIDKSSTDANYFASQVFALMGYSELANALGKESVSLKSPAWIETKSTQLLNKYSHKNKDSDIIIPEELIAAFNRANELASQNSYFQALALFQKITDQYPQEFLPYVGFSITLEKVGALEKSVQTLDKGISMVPDDAEHKEIKQILKQRAVTIKQKMNTLPAAAALPLQQTIVRAEKGSQMMAYVGGMITSSYTNFNFRYGYFVSGKSNASVDYGLTNSSGISSSNLGFTFYSREKSFVYGTGLMASFMNGTSTMYYKVSVGISFMNEKRTSSYDLFMDGNMGFKKQTPTVINVSIGKSLYFGKRK